MRVGRPTVAVFGASASAPGDGDYEDGVRCGRLLTEAGFAVATGGYGGLMEAVSEGAAAAGGHVIGVTAPSVFRGRQGANPHVTDELRAESLTERIHELTDLADASIALNGSLGTATELLVAWNLAFVAQFSASPARPIAAVGPRWAQVIPELARVLETDGSLVSCVGTVDEAVALIAERVV